MAKTFLGDIDSCDEHRKKSNLPVLSKEAKDDTECGEECPVAESCELRSTARGLQAALGESEWG